ncbi:MAG: PKD domain-containing protein [Gemmatimonadales bacterium]
MATTQCSEPLGPSDPHDPLPPASADVASLSSFILVGAGDIASCGSGGDEKTALLVENILKADATATAFVAGDNVYEDGSAAEYRDCYSPTWGRFKGRTRPSLGNHEYDGVERAKPSFDYFGDALWGNSRARGGYYSFNLGDSWHVVVLNSNAGFVSATAGSPQDQWLRADLAANSRPCIAAIWHHPRFFSSSDPASSLQRSGVKPFWEALYAAGADLVLNGHAHNYERFSPQTPDGAADPGKGIRQFIVGTGGKGVGGVVKLHPNSQITEGRTLGVMKLTLSPGSYSWELVPEAGKTFTDVGRADCHGSGTTPASTLATNTVPSAFFGSACTKLSCTFTDRSKDSDGSIVAWSWSFADGTASTARSPIHAYRAAGTYRVRLTVTDNRGAQGAVTHSVSVTP